MVQSRIFPNEKLMGNRRVSRVLFGVPPNRAFRRDAGNCTRGRARSPNSNSKTKDEHNNEGYVA